MPFFPRFVYPSTTSSNDFDSLFRLLREPTAALSSNRSAFCPNFDVQETEHEYVLEGELPGLNKKDLSIEFTDAQTLQVHGKIEKSYQSSSPADGDQNKAKEGKEQQQQKSSSAAAAEVQEKDENTQVSKKDDQKDARPKYWVSERTAGEFQRSFSFPVAVDQDVVKASLENGVLHIVVPKKAPAAGKRITVH